MTVSRKLFSHLNKKPNPIFVFKDKFKSDSGTETWPYLKDGHSKSLDS